MLSRYNNLYIPDIIKKRKTEYVGVFFRYDSNRFLKRSKNVHSAHISQEFSRILLLMLVHNISVFFSFYRSDLPNMNALSYQKVSFSEFAP